MFGASLAEFVLCCCSENIIYLLLFRLRRGTGRRIGVEGQTGVMNPDKCIMNHCDHTESIHRVIPEANRLITHSTCGLFPLTAANPRKPKTKLDLIPPSFTLRLRWRSGGGGSVWSLGQTQRPQDDCLFFCCFTGVNLLCDSDLTAVVVNQIHLFSVLIIKS